MVPYFEAAHPTAPAEAAAALVELVGSYDGYTRFQALEALARLHPPGVSAALVARLEERDDRRLREAAFPALVAMGDAAAIDFVLARGLYDGGGYGHVDTSRKAAQALVALGPRGHELLFEAVEKGGYLAQRAALEGLVATGDPALRARVEAIGKTTRDRGLQLLVRGLLTGG
jgi:HEAT repeat protein